MAGSKGTRRSSPIFWQNLLWKTGFLLLLLLFASQVAVIWLMGEQETADAFATGRRLVVALESGEISGKIIDSEDKPDVPETKSEIKPQQDEPAKKDDSVKEVNADDKTAPSADADEKPSPSPQVPATTPETKDASPQPDQDVKKDDQAEAGVTVPLINEEAEEALPAVIPSVNPTAILSQELIEKTEFGPLPKITGDGTKPWKYYSKSVTTKTSKPIISVIVTGLGANKKISELALRLPEAINLSFSPYAANLNSWMTSARTSGHELLLDLPMEASNYPVSDPGPSGLLVSKDQTDNETKIKKLMAHDFGYVGFVTPQDDVFLDNNELLKSLLHVLSGRGLMLVVGRQPAKNETRELIDKGNTASVIIDTVIDEELTPTAIRAHLTLLEQTAKQRGYAVGVAKAYPITIKQLNEWAGKLDADGFTLVPVSLIVAKRF